MMCFTLQGDTVVSRCLAILHYVVVQFALLSYYTNTLKRRLVSNVLYAHGMRVEVNLWGDSLGKYCILVLKGQLGQNGHVRILIYEKFAICTLNIM